MGKCAYGRMKSGPKHMGKGGKMVYACKRRTRSKSTSPKECKKKGQYSVKQHYRKDSKGRKTIYVKRHCRK